jgi:CubicO group peptidase (beta-lactamase class C family)
MRRPGRGVRRLVIWAALMVAAVVYRPDRAIEVALGTTAHDLCSETFVAGLDPDQTFRESLAPRPGYRWLAHGIRWGVDREHREAHASLLGLLPVRAVFRDGLGCVLVHGDESVAGMPIATMPHAASQLPEIAGDAVVEPIGARWKSTLDAAFEEPADSPHRWTKAVVVVRDGKVIAERYAPGYGIATPILGFSMTKSVTNALVGILVREGRLDVAQPAPIAAWRGAGDPRRDITLEHLMRMDSGLALDETGSGFDPSNLMFYDEPDMAAYAQAAKPIAPPGTRWRYSSASTQLVSRIVRDRVGGTGEAAQRFAFGQLFDVLGMRNVTFEADATGTPIGAHYLFASARDWARFGMLFLDDGMIGAQRLLPAGWIEWSTRPTLGTQYGAGWWTNRGDDAAATHRRAIGLPADAFFAFGNLGQRIAIIPSEHLVIVRMARAHLPYGDMAGFERLVVASIAAANGPAD